MDATTIAVDQKCGEYPRTKVGPMNRSEEPRFGLMDGLIIGFVLLFAGGLISLLLSFS